ncbi:hypothetical protein TRFO_18974 [Tritrichomonas foetus]|uniref:Uncharacterized protein n=1 Tax=Tritrichomonas foetus TaxID=1144522 RepID=A0A1J4KJN7_9EUKA|nr:hypothetical protein TRFO_18974 [Tritrichomonas foetus]|eukprot:OHT11529.1 hypothetical protein TRFO_18974 [Tritrichomonas foetus]
MNINSLKNLYNNKNSDIFFRISHKLMKQNDRVMSNSIEKTDKTDYKKKVKMVVIRLDIQTILTIYGICVSIFSGITYAYERSRTEWSSVRLSCPGWWDTHYGSCGYHNEYYFLNYTVTIFMIFSFLFAVVELGILLDIKYAKIFKKNLYRGVIYFFKSFATLGTAADLGIAAGSFEIICGLVHLIIFAIFFVKSRQGGGRKGGED